MRFSASTGDLSLASSMRIFCFVALLGWMHSAAAVELTEPTVIKSDSSIWSATLSVEVGRYDDGDLSFTTRLYCYLGQCSYPGPTIEIKQGDTFSLTVVNKLGAETGPMVHNLMHWPNTTNVHTHGLHVDPNVDTVFVSVPPGGSRTYVYKIPANHHPGQHWYHSHVHGSSAFLLMGGLHGALRIVPSTSSSSLVPATYSAMTQTTVVLSHIQFAQVMNNGQISQGCSNGGGCTVWQGCAAGTTNSPFSPFRSYSMLEWSPEIGNNMDLAPTYASGTAPNKYVANGQFGRTYTVSAGEYRILRVVHAGGAYVLEFATPQGCTFDLVAIDGIYLKAKQSKQRVLMNQAGRFDVQVMCQNAGSYPLQITYGDATRVTQTLFTIVATATSSGARTAVSDTELAALVRPSYLNDLTSSTVDAKFSVHFSQGGRPVEPCGFWLGSGSDCTAIWAGTAQPSATIAGNSCPFQQFAGQQGGTGYDAWNSSYNYKHVTAVGQVNEWKIYGLGNDAHPFHLHVNHFQIMSFTPTVGSVQDYTQYYNVGEWRDTVPALDGELTIRFLASDFAGETVFHCHFLRHEDLGMMSSMYVCDPYTAGACPPALDKSASATGSSSTTAAAASSSSTGSTPSGINILGVTSHATSSFRAPEVCVLFFILIASLLAIDRL